MKSIFVSTSLLIGSTMVHGACTDGTMTFNSNNGGKTKALGVCEIIQNGGDGSQMYLCNTNDDGVELITYTDNACQTEDGNGGADQAANIDAFVCTSVSDCDYMHIYKWTPSGQTCGTFSDAITSGSIDVTSELLTSSDSGTGDLDECLEVGQTTWGITSALDCTTDFEGNILALETYSDDTCTTSTSTITNTATQGSTDAPAADGDCRRLVECSDVALAPTENPTTAPSVAPSAAPTEAPTDAPTIAPSAAPTTAPSAAPTAAPVPTEAPTDAPSTAPSAAPSAAPTAAPVADTSAPSAAPTAAPTTASSAVQITSIMSLVMAAFYVIIA